MLRTQLADRKMPNRNNSKNGRVLVDRRFRQNSVTFNNRYLLYTSLERLRLNILYKMLARIERLMLLDEDAYDSYSPVRRQIIERIFLIQGGLPTRIWVPRAQRLVINRINTIEDAIRVFGPTESTFIAVFALTPRQLARLLLGDYLAILTDDEEADVACDFEQIFKCSGKSFYDPTRRQVIPLVRSILLLCCRLRSGLGVRATADKFGCSPSNVSNCVSFALHRFTYYFGHLLDIEVGLPMFAQRLPNTTTVLPLILNDLNGMQTPLLHSQTLRSESLTIKLR